MESEYIAWFTGFFEGEGTVSFTYYTDRKGLRKIKNIKLVVGQSGERGLALTKELQGMFGGHLGCHQQHEWQKCYTWAVYSREKVLELLELMMPYLRVRKKEMEEKIKAIKDWQNTRVYNLWTPDEIEGLKKIEQSRNGHLVRLYSQSEWKKMFPRHGYNSIRATRKKLQSGRYRFSKRL